MKNKNRECKRSSFINSLQEKYYLSYERDSVSALNKVKN